MAEPEKAREELATVLQMDPASKDGRAQLAELDFWKHRLQGGRGGIPGASSRPTTAGASRASQEPRSLRASLQRAIQFASDQVKRSPEPAEMRALALAETLFAAGSYTAAAAQFQILIDQRSRKSTLLYLQMGEAKLDGGDIPGALAAFQTARQLAPSDARAVLDLALLYDRTGRSEQARKEYEIVIQLQPENATALNNLAYLEAEAGVDLDQALAHAQRAQQTVARGPGCRGHARAGLHPEES